MECIQKSNSKMLVDVPFWGLLARDADLGLDFLVDWLKRLALYLARRGMKTVG